MKVRCPEKTVSTRAILWAFVQQRPKRLVFREKSAYHEEATLYEPTDCFRVYPEGPSARIVFVFAAYFVGYHDGVDGEFATGLDADSRANPRVCREVDCCCGYVSVFSRLDGQ